MIFEFIKSYREWRRDHKEEVLKARLRKQLLKAPLDYNLLEQFLLLFIDENKRDLIVEVQGKDFTTKLYWDNNAIKRSTSVTQSILNNYGELK